MRVISQDGCFDMPFEQVMLQRHENKIYVLNENFGGVEKPLSDPVIADYSTEEKAIRVMEMLRTEYERHFFGNGGVMATADFYVQPFAFIPPKVFRFPRDSEV